MHFASSTPIALPPISAIESVRLERISTIEALHAFRGEWSRFVQEHPASTPFHLPEWLLTWWAHFGSGSLHVLVCRSEDRISAVLPCFLLEWKGRRQLTLIGTGITDYLDPLIESGRGAELPSMVRQYLGELPEWEIVDWTDLSPEHPLFALAGAVKKPGMPCAEIPFNGAFDAYWSLRGKELRRNLRRYRERAEQTAPLHFEVCTSAHQELVQTLIRLHTKRWESQGEPGMVEANQSAGFLKDVAEQMSAAGIARFFVLRYGGRVAALILAFAYRQKIFAYMSAFDPEYAPLGLGRTLLFEAIRDSFPKYHAWNFLRGDEPYKIEWGGQLYPRARLMLERLPELSG